MQLKEVYVVLLVSEFGKGVVKFHQTIAHVVFFLQENKLSFIQGKFRKIK